MGCLKMFLSAYITYDFTNDSFSNEGKTGYLFVVTFNVVETLNSYFLTSLFFHQFEFNKRKMALVTLQRNSEIFDWTL